MTEREALLTAVMKNPRDRTPLLVYADWLQERPELPAAGATEELIRLACEKNGGRYYLMPPWCLEWLTANWTRLVPSVAARHRPFQQEVLVTNDSSGYTYKTVTNQFGDGARIEKKVIDVLVGLEGYTRRGENVYPCRLKLHLGFGLLVGFEMKSAFGRERVEPLLALDQPQLTMEFPPAEAPAKHKKSAVSEILKATMDAMFPDD